MNLVIIDEPSGHTGCHPVPHSERNKLYAVDKESKTQTRADRETSAINFKEQVELRRGTTQRKQVTAGATSPSTAALAFAPKRQQNTFKFEFQYPLNLRVGEIPLNSEDDNQVAVCSETKGFTHTHSYIRNAGMIRACPPTMPLSRLIIYIAPSFIALIHPFQKKS